MSYEKSTPESPEAQSSTPVQDNLKALANLFPSVVRDGQVDVDALRQLCGEAVVKDDELYGLNWRGKAEARHAALIPSLGTLRPCKEESKDWDTTKNLYIEGDNLEVLKLLRKSYGGKVKMIYIDPPYNTGKEFVYPDNYQNSIENYKKLTGQEGKYAVNAETSGRYHTDWLNMMYPRLLLARDFMTEDGVLFISIDEKESSNLKEICDEVMGQNNFVAQFVWAAGRKNDSKYVSISHEYIICYFKNIDYVKDKKTIWREKKNGLSEIYAEYERLKNLYKDDTASIEKKLKLWYKTLPDGHPAKDHSQYSRVDEKGIFFADNISWPGGGGDKYEVIHPITNKPVTIPSRGWLVNKETMDEWIKSGKVMFGETEKNVPTYKAYLKDREFSVPYSVLYKDGRASSKRLQALMGDKVFENPKDEEIIQRIIEFCGVRNRDIVLDFFAGSSTVAHSVFLASVNKHIDLRFILVQLPELISEKNARSKRGKKVARAAIELCKQLSVPNNICEIGKERIRRAGAKVKEEAGEAGKDLDIGFRVYKLDSSNVRAWNPQAADLASAVNNYAEHLMGGRTEDDFLTEIMLKSGIDLVEDVTERVIAGHRVQSMGYGQYYACMATDLTDDAEEVALGIASWHEEERVNAGGEQEDICTVFVSDRAFGNQDAVKMNFVAILEQHGICNIKAL